MTWEALCLDAKMDKFLISPLLPLRIFYLLYKRCLMNELSYSAALDAGIEPITYRSDALESLGPGTFAGQLDALVWSKRQPCLMALITLEKGIRVQVVGFQRHTRKDMPEYLGLRDLYPEQQVMLAIDRGIRGGLRPTVYALEQWQANHPTE